MVYSELGCVLPRQETTRSDPFASDFTCRERFPDSDMVFVFKTELPDRTTVLLPVSSKDRTKEENHKLLNGTGVDPADRVHFLN